MEQNKNKSKKMIIILITIFSILVIGTGSFAYLYFGTDLLKSDKQLFFQYLFQQADKNDLETRANEYFEKQKQVPFENNGKLTADVTIPGVSDEVKEKVEQAKKMDISFNGKSDAKNNKAQQDISINYSNDVSFPVSYRQDGDIFGLQTKYVGTKYVAARNDEIPELLEKMGATNIRNIPNKIEFQETRQLEFSEKEKKELNQKYGNVLKEQLKDEQFSRAETKDGTSYTLEMTPDQLKDVLVKLLDTFKNDDKLIKKINDYLANQDTVPYLTKNGSTKTKLENSDIDDLINAIKDMKIKENVKITVYQKDRKTSKIYCQTGAVGITIQKNKKEDTLVYTIGCKITEKDKAEVNFYVTMQLEGLKALTSVKENWTVSFQIVNLTKNEEMKYEYHYENTVNFKDKVNIDDLNKDTAMILNDQNQETVTTLLMAVGTRIQQVNQSQMQELGTTENPVVYLTPITLILNSMIKNQANPVINSNSINEIENQIENEFENELEDPFGENEENEEVLENEENEENEEENMIEDLEDETSGNEEDITNWEDNE